MSNILFLFYFIYPEYTEFQSVYLPFQKFVTVLNFYLPVK